MSLKTETQLMEAFDRLVSLKPTNSVLKAKVVEGKRLVNFSNVALEAGVSRRLIAYEGCPYPKVRARVLSYLASAPTVRPSTALVKTLRAEIRELMRQLELRDTYNAELLIELQRLSKERGGNHLEDGKVANFRQDRRRRKNKI